nr:hypothetical protein JVH1_8466 [Rhodococcus sp. JVH1]
MTRNRETAAGHSPSGSARPPSTSMADPYGAGVSRDFGEAEFMLRKQRIESGQGPLP